MIGSAIPSAAGAVVCAVTWRASAPAANPVVPRLLRGTPGVVKAVRVPDPRTVQIVLALPYAPLLSVLAHPALAIVRLSQGADGSARWTGTGPFLVAESLPADHLSATTMPNLWRRAGHGARFERHYAGELHRHYQDLASAQRTANIDAGDSPF